MSIFGSYSQYYDLLYQDKNYQKEAEFVTCLLKKHAPNAHTILELGCGTGRHAEHLVADGYEVTGLEVSPEMLAICRRRRDQMPSSIRSGLQIVEGDLRTTHFGERFDVVLALFHVMSYQTRNEDLQAAFDRVREHLKPGGVFIFDVWYGPAVLSDRPVSRIKHVESDDFTVTRFAQPVLAPNENWVEVQYRIYVQDKATQRCEYLEEVHRMRYLFRPELVSLLKASDLNIIEDGEWLTAGKVGFDTWNVFFIGRAQ